MDKFEGQGDAKNMPGEKKGAWQAPDILLKPAFGGLLVLIPGLLGFITGNLWLFPSLGPTIFLQVVSPRHSTASFYNVVAGQLIGVFCGYSLAILSGAAGAPSAFGSDRLQLSQVIASCAAIALMILLQMPLKAAHPPAASTALLIALGGFKATWHDFFTIIVGIAIIAVAGEILRRILISMEHYGHRIRYGEDEESVHNK